MLLAEDTGWIKSTIDAFAYAITALGWPGLLIFLAILGLIWYARKFGDAHHQEIKSRSTLIDIMAEHVPKQTETLGTLSALVAESRQKDSDVIREVVASHSKIDDLASAMVEHGCPDSKEVLAARLSQYLDRSQKRTDEMNKVASDIKATAVETMAAMRTAVHDVRDSAHALILSNDLAAVAANPAIAAPQPVIVVNQKPMPVEIKEPG